MKRQATASIINKQSERQILLSAGLVLVAMGSNAWIMAGAQSINQDSCLPPEVIPVNSAIKYVPNTAADNISTNQVPGIVEAGQPAAAQPAFQSAQEARQSLFNSLMGTNVYPQFSGQNSGFNPTGNMAGIQNQTVGQTAPQTLGNDPNQTGQSNLITPNQFNSSNSSQLSGSVNAQPSQTQTLTGATPTPSTSQPHTSGGVGKLVGLAAGLGLSGLSLANGGVGNIYSAGLLGGSMVNYGVRNGFNF